MILKSILHDPLIFVFRSILDEQLYYQVSTTYSYLHMWTKIYIKLFVFIFDSIFIQYDTKNIFIFTTDIRIDIQTR